MTFIFRKMPPTVNCRVPCRERRTRGFLEYRDSHQVTKQESISKFSCLLFLLLLLFIIAIIVVYYYH